MLLANLLLLFLLQPLQPAMLLPLQRYQVGLTRAELCGCSLQTGSHCTDKHAAQQAGH